MTLSVTVWDFMDRSYQKIGPTATLGEAMEAMSEKNMCGASTRSLVVVDAKDRPLGVISMRNILNAFKPEFSLWASLLGKAGWEESLEKGLKQCNYRLVEDYMVKTPQLKMSDDLLTAFQILTEKNLEVRMVPVVEGGKVEGVVRIPELFETFVEAYRKMGTA